MISLWKIQLQLSISSNVFPLQRNQYLSYCNKSISWNTIFLVRLMFISMKLTFFYLSVAVFVHVNKLIPTHICQQLVVLPVNLHIVNNSTPLPKWDVHQPIHPRNKSLSINSSNFKELFYQEYYHKKSLKESNITVEVWKNYIKIYEKHH